jgi:hypothetical protein
MKILTLVLSVVSILLLGFGAWGRFAEAGKLQFDEMAGIIPYACWYAGIFLGIVSLLAWGFLAYKSS